MSIRSTSATPTPAGNLARIAVLVIIALVAATAVWLGTRGDDGKAASGEQGQGSSEIQTDTSGSGSEQLAPDTAAEAPADGVALPTGSTQTEGYSTGFPYTDLGAVALQVELAKAQIGFDYDQAASVAQLYVDPKDQAVFGDRSRDAVVLRRQQAGVPDDGAVPPPASYAVTPVAYTLKQLDTDYYVVNLLSYVTLTSADGQARDGLYAGTQLVRWTADPDSEANAEGGDWKVVQGSSTDLQKLVEEGQPQAVAPDTPEFEQAGWIMINSAATAGIEGDTAGGTGESS